MTMAEGFFLTLPSNSSMLQYPENCNSHFITYLPETYDLTNNDEYEVGLCELIVPNTITNILKGTARLQFKKSKNEKVCILELKEGLYDTPVTLIDKLNEMIHSVYPNNERNKIKKVEFTYCIPTKIAKLKLYNTTATMELSPTLQRILQMPPGEITSDVESSGPVDIHEEGNSLYVYSDLAVSRQIGDMQAPLLRVIPLSYSGNFTHRIYIKPHYIPLSRKVFNTVEIDIRTDKGKVPSFMQKSSQRTVVTLHVRARKILKS